MPASCLRPRWPGCATGASRTRRSPARARSTLGTSHSVAAGPAAVALLESANLTLIAALAGLALPGAIGWLVLRAREGRAPRSNASAPRRW
ncbi:MAG: hypothetical protein ACRDF0_01760, partial [Candidatus Limnocylindria bacterium]